MQLFLKGAFHQKIIIKITFINSALSQQFGSKPIQQFEYNALKKGPGHQRKRSTSIQSWYQKSLHKVTNLLFALF
jgi:hypothetical protein